MSNNPGTRRSFILKAVSVPKLCFIVLTRLLGSPFSHSPTSPYHYPPFVFSLMFSPLFPFLPALYVILLLCEFVYSILQAFHNFYGTQHTCFFIFFLTLSCEKIYGSLLFFFWNNIIEKIVLLKILTLLINCILSWIFLFFFTSLRVCFLQFFKTLTFFFILFTQCFLFCHVSVTNFKFLFFLFC